MDYHEGLGVPFFIFPAMKVHISDHTKALLDTFKTFLFSARGDIQVKVIAKFLIAYRIVV